MRYGNPDGPRYREVGSPFGGGIDPSEPTQVTRRTGLTGGALAMPFGGETSAMGTSTLPQKGVILLAGGVGVVVGLVMMAVAMAFFR